MKSNLLFIFSGVICGLWFGFLAFIWGIGYAWDHQENSYLLARIFFLYFPIIFPVFGFFVGKRISNKNQGDVKKGVKYLVISLTPFIIILLFVLVNNISVGVR